MRTILRDTEGGSDGSTVRMEPKRTYGVGRDPGTILDTEKQSVVRM